MSMIMSEVALQRTVQIGLANLRANQAAFNDIFGQYLSPEMNSSYGQAHIDNIYNWFQNTKVPVVQSWSFDPQKVPAYSIHLADEPEDESKASMGNYWGMGADAEILTGVSTISLDVGIHADKSKDHVLWMYYILNYIFYKEIITARNLGLQNYTFRANEYNKESKYMADNVWSRWVRFKCTVQNYLDGEAYVSPGLDLSVDAESSANSTIVNITNINIPPV